VRGLALALLFGLAWGAAGEAQAQNVDWVVNLDDAGSDPSPAGGTVTYNIDVANNGFDTAPATTIDLDVPAGTTLSAVDETGGISGCAPVPATGPATVICTVPSLAATASVQLSADVTTTASGTIAFGAGVPTDAGGVSDTDTANNDQTETTTITAGADVGLSVSGPASAASGSTVTYSFEIENAGPDPASNLQLDFPVPTGFTGVSAPAG
jgi:uncharacterized repeat protein (TIGR01451 family)